jgi:hypothetical protein
LRAATGGRPYISACGAENTKNQKTPRANLAEERKRRGNLKMFDFIMNEIASLRSQ